MVKLDYLTLGVVISLVGTIAAVVMLITWRINREQSGLGMWALGAIVGAIGFFILYFKPVLGSYAVFLNNVASLLSPLLILEGVLQYKDVGNRRRRRWFFAVVALVIVCIAYFNRDNATRRFLMHDALAIGIFTTSIVALLFKTGREHLKVYALSIVSFAFITTGFVIRWVLAFRGVFETREGHPYMGIVFMMIIFWIVGWTYGLIVVVNYDAKRRIEKMATTDALTGLMNRTRLYEQIGDKLSEADARGAQLGVFLLDINGFKQLNDTFGHAFGDAVLVRIAEVLKAFVNESELAIRLGGDEFLLFVDLTKRATGAEAMAQAVRKAAETPYELQARCVQLRVSIGSAVYSGGAVDVDKLIAAADQSMYVLKTPERLLSEVI